MIIWALLSVFLVDSAVGTPLRGLEDDGKYGYQYDVKHPAGSSRVHVSSGSDRNRNYYPSSIHHGDYISDSTYDDPTYVGPVYRPNRDRHYPRSYPEGPSYGHIPSKVPVYEEHSFPRSPVYRSAPAYDRFSTHDREHYGSNPGFAQSGFDAGYEKPTSPTYSKPYFVQQVSVNEPIPDKFEQIAVEPIIQKTLVKDFSRPNSYSRAKTPVPSYNKYEQSPIDQQVLVEEQSPIDQQILVEEPSPVAQKALVYEQSPIGQKVLVDEQSPIDQKILIDEQSPIDQQILVDKQSPIDQKVIVDEQSPLDQQILVEEPKGIILQKPLNDKPEISQIPVDVPSVKGAPIVQQASVDYIPSAKPTFYVANKPPLVQQVADDGPYSFTKKSPVTQKTIEHPSQAVYDSPIEPSFSDVDRYAPPQSYKTAPRYRFVPTGPPYEKISHFTKVIHAPPRPYYPPRSYYPPQGYPQKHIKTTFPVYKKPPVSYSIKYPPPPPPPRPVTKTFVPVNLQYSRKTNIFTKQPPVSPSVKLPPPPPITKTYVPPPPSVLQYHVDPPLSQPIKLPPPAPVTKSIKPPVLSQVQENIDGDILLVKSPPVAHSVKVPPPAPATKTVTPYAQEYINADRYLTKNPPVSQSIKAPPPAPITKTLIQADLPEAQEYVDADVIPTKNVPAPYSVKTPQPAPVTKTVAAPVPNPQQYIDEDIVIKKSPQSVKLPPPPSTKSIANVKLPPPPVTKSVASVKLPPPPVTKSVASVKLPPPPVTKSVASVKLPPPPVTKSVTPAKQESIDDDIVSVKYPPVSQSVKTPPVSQTVVPSYEQKLVDIPSTKNAPYSVKQPPVPVQVYEPVILEKSTYDKEPFHGQKTVEPSQYKLPSVVSYFNKPQYADPIPSAPYTIKQPYSAPPISPAPSQGVKYPVVKNVPSVKQPVKSVAANSPHVNSHFSALAANDKRPYSQPTLKQPHPSSPEYEPSDISYPEDGPIKKYTPVFDDAPYPESVHEEGYGSNIPPDSPHFDEPVEEKSPFDKYPVSHAVRLPSIVPPPKVGSTSPVLDDNLSVDGIGESSPFNKYPPVSHSVILPTSPKVTPNLFASLPPDSHVDTFHDSDISAPKSEAYVSPASHSVRLPLPIQGNNYKIREKTDESKQKFPAFPVESALKQPDPVADKVAELSHSFTPGEGYDDSNSGPSDSNAPSIEEAREEIERLNREIGRPFGSRLARRSNSGFVRIRRHHS